MKIILTKDIPKIGKKNEIKEVADGYALNFVIPRGLGVKATEAGIQKVQSMKGAMETEKKMQDELLTKSLSDLSAITVTISEKTNEKGHLFAGIDTTRLAKEIEATTGMAFDPDTIEIEKPIKQTGNFIVTVSVKGKKGKVKVVVEALKN